MKQKTMVPEDFIVAARIRELAAQNGWPNPDEEVAAFVDHHRAKGSLFLDHEAAFRTWLRRAAKWNKNGSRRTKSEELEEQIEQTLRRGLG